MNPHLAKSTICSLLALVLVYYSAAWAVLRCFHEEDLVDREAVVSQVGTRATTVQQIPDGSAEADFHCMDSDYHNEILAAPVAPVELRLLRSDFASPVSLSPGSRSGGKFATSDLWLSALFDSDRALDHPTGLPRYLSLSVLRI